MSNQILIVEDDLLIAEHLKALLIKENYCDIEIVTDYDSAIKYLTTNTPNLILLDVNLEGKKTGIDVANVAKDSQIPFIYITAQSEKPIIEKIIETKPLAYILKPFNTIAVVASVKLALGNIKNTIIILKSGTKATYKLDYNTIVYIKSFKNYIEITTTNKSFLIRSTLKKIKELLPNEEFSQANRSTLVNNHFIEQKTNYSIVVYGIEILLKN